MLLFITTFLCAQDGQLSLGGTVINSVTGEPVKRALVQIFGQRGVEPTQPFTASAFTDSEGAFRFTGLTAGAYSISARKPQFAQFDIGRSGRIKLAASIGDVKLGLSPLGVITGKVVDQSGQPLLDVNIVALSVRADEGLRQTSTELSVSTDDRGIYRLWGLRPGKHYLKAAGRSAGTSTYIGDPSPQSLPEEGFAAQYFGGGGTIASAVPIAVEAGAEARADLTLKMERAYRIRGSLRGRAPLPAVKFELLTGGEDVSAGRVSVNGETGQFLIHNVAPGSYILRATQDQTSGEVAVSVGGSDVNAGSLTLSPAVDMEMSVRTIGAPPDTASEEGFPVFFTGVVCTTTLHPAGGRSGPPSFARSGQDGALAVRGVVPGAYRVGVNCSGGYPQTMISGGHDLLADPIVAVQPGVAPPALEIVAHYGGGTIQGTVLVDSSPKSDSIWVLLVPQFPGSAGPTLLTAYQDAVEGDGFHFSADWLAPGAYMAYAFLNQDGIEYRNPQFLQSLTQGVRVQVEDGSKKTITISGVER